MDSLFFIFLPEEEGVLNVDGVSGWRNRKDDPADIFDPEGMKQALSDPELGIRLEEMGIEHTIYMLQPAPVPGS